MKKMKRISALLLSLLLLVALVGCGSSSSDITGDTCTISISCSTAAARLDEFADYAEVIPEDGVILDETVVAIEEGDTVYDILSRVTAEAGIIVSTQSYGDFLYVDGIGGLFAAYCGDYSGWMFSVNDEYPDYSCEAIEVADGDVIVFAYTCDWGDLPGTGDM